MRIQPARPQRRPPPPKLPIAPFEDDAPEPAEDWAGMTPEQMLADAKDPDNKRHKDIAGLSDEELMQIITELMAK